jgi:hypothetical protein
MPNAKKNKSDLFQHYAALANKLTHSPRFPRLDLGQRKSLYPDKEEDLGVVPPASVALANKQQPDLIDLGGGGSENSVEMLSSAPSASRLPKANTWSKKTEMLKKRQRDEKKSEVLAHKMAAEPQNKRTLRSNSTK